LASAAAAKNCARLLQVRLRAVADQAQVGLVDQGGGLKGVTGFLLGGFLGRQLRSSS
jgi:hypothetical protein